MSGHSHAKTVKRVKDANDAKRGNVFSKLARIITIAAKEGGDPNSNSKLRAALENAKKYNLPKENVERAIKRGTGELVDEQLTEVLFEAIMPNNVYLILEGITDNNRRTLSEIKQIIQKNNGKLANEGAVRYMFDKLGIVIVNLKGALGHFKNKEELELAVIEAGAEDFSYYSDDEEEFMEIKTKMEDLEKVKANLEAKGIILDSSTLGWQAKQTTEITEKQKEALDKLFEELDDNEAVQEIYSNLAL